MKLQSTHPPTAYPSVPHSFTNPDHSVLSVAWEMLSISLFCQLWIPFIVHWLVIMTHMGVITLNSRKPWAMSVTQNAHIRRLIDFKNTFDLSKIKFWTFWNGSHNKDIVDWVICHELKNLKNLFRYLTHGVCLSVLEFLYVDH